MSQRPTEYGNEVRDIHDNMTDETGNMRARLGLLQDSLRIMLDDITQADTEESDKDWMIEMIQVLTNAVICMMSVIEAQARDEIMAIAAEVESED